MKYLKDFILISLLWPLALHAQEEKSGLWDTFTRNIKETWQSPTHDLYVPINTWHNHWTYSQEKLDSYNEKPWGIGYGFSRFDKDGDWHSVFAMKLQDSHNRAQYNIGYGYQKNWYPDNAENWRLGLGFTAAIVARHDYFDKVHYVPLPIVLPVVSVEYKRLAIQSLYIPGTYNNGNVLFTWVRWQIN